MTQYRILVDGKEYFPRLIERSHTTVRFELEGKLHEVTITPSFQTSRERSSTTSFPQQSSVTPSQSLPSSSAGNELRTPMPGVVVSLAVKEGDSVTRGQTVVVVEAMKMENNIPAPKDGVIEKIYISAGQELEPNALLLSFSS